MSGQHVWTATAEGDVRSLYRPTTDETVLGVAAAPSGDLVAALVERAAPEPGTMVLVLDANGAIQQQIAVGSSRALATPVVAASVPTVDWSPQGDRLLVLLQDGEILAIALASDAPLAPKILKPPGEDIRAAAWSPTGEAIAYLAASAENRSRSLVVQSAGSGAAHPVVPASDERAVVEFSWMPDGAALLFTEGAIAAGAISGVDLWQVATDGTDRQLVASAGSVAPIARITIVRPSPDGRRVAYAVLVPGDDLPRFDSIWVRDLASRAGYQVEMPPVAAVRDIWWTASGLLILADEAADSSVQTGTAVLLHVAETGVAQIVWRAPRPAATPVAGTPVASPASS